MPSPRPAIWFCAFVALTVPAVSAQFEPAQSTVRIQASVIGSWGADGYVNPNNETARWTISVDVEFNDSSVCAEDTTLRLRLENVENAEAELDGPGEYSVPVEAGGRTAYNEDVTFAFPADVAALVVGRARVIATLDACPSPVGTQVGASTDMLLDAQVGFVPRIDVVAADAEVDEANVRFPFTVTSGANGPMKLRVESHPLPGYNDTSINAPLDQDLAAGESIGVLVEFALNEAGFHELRFIGEFDHSDAQRHPLARFTTTVEVLSPVAVTEQGSSPGFGAVAVLAAVAWALVAAVGRR